MIDSYYFDKTPEDAQRETPIEDFTDALYFAADAVASTILGGVHSEVVGPDMARILGGRRCDTTDYRVQIWDDHRKPYEMVANASLTRRVIRVHPVTTYSIGGDADKY